MSQQQPEKSSAASRSPELAGQIAALAEQVRQLRGRVGDAPRAEPVLERVPEPVPTAMPSAPFSASAAAPVAPQSPAPASTAMPPERAPAPPPSPALGRRALAVLAAETDRVRQSVEILQTKIRALDAELRAMYERLGATPRPPVLPAALASAPAASPDTSPRQPA